jgi:hypothetical protein
LATMLAADERVGTIPYFVEDTRHWQVRADEARALAKTLADPASKRAMEEIAAAYERMALRAEERVTTRDPGEPA